MPVNTQALIVPPLGQFLRQHLPHVLQLGINALIEKVGVRCVGGRVRYAWLDAKYSLRYSEQCQHHVADLLYRRGVVQLLGGHAISPAALPPRWKHQR